VHLPHNKCTNEKRTSRGRVQRHVVRESRNAAALELLGVVVTNISCGEKHEKDVRIGLAVRGDHGNAHDALRSDVLQTVHVHGEVGTAAGADVIHVLQLGPEHRARELVGYIRRAQINPVILINLAHHEIISTYSWNETDKLVNKKKNVKETPARTNV